MKMQYALLRHHLHRHVKSGDRVLDAGCGPGTFAKQLLALAARVTCLDISQVQLEACRQRVPGCDAYELGSVTDLSRFADGSFDLSLAFGGVLSYCFEKAPEAVAELMRVTRPGGLVGLSAMNLYGSLHTFLPGVLALPVATNRQIAATGNLDRLDNERHECHMFRVEEFRQVLSTSGITDIKLYAAGWLVQHEDLDLPDVDSEMWRFLFEAELVATTESPGCGTHIIAWGRVS
jgi:SAM-dependent methyltransferase